MGLNTAKKRLPAWLWQLALILILWDVAGRMLANPFILPSPLQVAKEMAAQAASARFFYTIAVTTLFAFGSWFVSFLFAGLLALAARKPGMLASFLDHIVLFLRSIPNIAFIILLLFWVPRNTAVVCVSFLLLFPITYTALLAALRSIDEKWQAVFKVYPHSLFYRLKTVYIPLARHDIQACLLSSASLAFKSVAMAEVLCQSAAGIGKAMQTARFEINVAGVMGWTLWLVLLCALADGALRLAFGQWKHM